MTVVFHGARSLSQVFDCGSFLFVEVAHRYAVESRPCAAVKLHGLPCSYSIVGTITRHHSSTEH